MSDDLEFLKNEVSRLKAEQIIFGGNPLTRLAKEKEIQETLRVIHAIENERVIDEGAKSGKLDVKSEIMTISDAATSPSREKPHNGIKDNSKSNLLDSPVGYVFLSALAAVLALMIAHLIYQYFGIHL